MRTLMAVGLVLGPVLVLGATMMLTPGPAASLPLVAYGAFVLAAVAALGGVLLLVLSLRRPAASRSRPVAALPAAASSPVALPAPREPAEPAATTEAADPAVPFTVPRRVGSRYLVADPETASAPTPRVVFCHPRGADDVESPATPAEHPRYVTLRTRRDEARVSAGCHR